MKTNPSNLLLWLRPLQQKFFAVGIWGFLLAIYPAGIHQAQSEIRRVQLTPMTAKGFNLGERITYRVHYGWITAGEATMKVHPSLKSYNGRDCYHVEIKGISAPWAKYITDIEDVWGAYLDTASIQPHKCYRDIRENNYKKKEEITFDYEKQKATVTASTDPKGDVKIGVDRVLDMVSGYFNLRLVDYDKLAPLTWIEAKGIYETKTYDFKIRYMGKERIETPEGWINAIKLQPKMPDNGVFAGENSVRFYISDDVNRIPVKIKADLFVGAVVLDIKNYENLKAPLHFGKKR